MNTNNIAPTALDRGPQNLARPQKCGCWRRNWRRLALVMLLLLVVLAGGAYWFLIGRVHRLEVYCEAMRAIRADKQLQELLGEPMHSVKWPPRSAVPSARIEDREIDIHWAIHGPKAQAKAHVTARLMAGKWETVVLEVELADHKKLSPRIAGDSGLEAPPFPSGGAAQQKPDGKKPEANAPAPEINLPIPPDAPSGK